MAHAAAHEEPEAGHPTPGTYAKIGLFLFVLTALEVGLYEFTHFVHKGLTLQRNMFGASFFTLTGFHGTHVTIGVIWLITMFVLALRGQLTPERSLKLEMAALYWHFVDVVWIIIFPVVYLIK